MKDPYEVLRQKGLELERVRNEIQALRFVTPLLSEDKEAEPEARSSFPSLGRSAAERWPELFTRRRGIELPVEG
jgi:hypothetical protein